VLEAICRAAAPLLPLTTDAIWRGLTGEPSVHLADWPELAGWPEDAELASAMDLVRAVCSTALGLRKARQLRVRLPLARLTVGHPDAQSLAQYADLIRDEVNVKDVELLSDPAGLGTFELAVNPRTLGPRIGAKVQEVIRAVKAGNWERHGDSLTAAGIELAPGEFDVRLVAADPDSTSALPGNAGLVALDTAVTPELAAEGTARDVVRTVQQARRDAKLAVTDRIRLTIGADGLVADAIRAFAEFIAGETLAVDVQVRPAEDVDAPAQAVADGGSVRVSVVPAS
jgi:isoleucyl-tRNA synthetase